MPAKVIVIGLDSMDPLLVERWAGDGLLPGIASVAARGRTFELGGCMRTLPASIWAELTSGRLAARIGWTFPVRQLHAGETAPRQVELAEVDPRAFWTAASDAGLRVAAVDMPISVPPPSLNGIFLSGWSEHDILFGARSIPPGLADEVVRRHGAYPVTSCDHDFERSPAGKERLLDGLLQGVPQATGCFLDLLGREDWDLFACAYGQPQCVGHHYWGPLETEPAPGDPLAARFHTAILDVYQAIDRGIAALVEAAGPDAAVVLIPSHGMARPTGGYQLLPEVLVRLGMGSGRGATAQVRSRLPRPLRRALRALVPGGARMRLQAAAGSLLHPLDSPDTRAAAFESTGVGCVRLNLRGREPHGRVEPGPEADALLEELRRELLELVDPDTGGRIVERVVTADELMPAAERHPDVVDLLVYFRRDLGLVEACSSPRIGTVRIPFQVADRTGDHTPESRALVAGPGIAPAAGLTGDTADVAPTVLALLGVEPPAWMDGRPLPLA